MTERIALPAVTLVAVDGSPNPVRTAASLALSASRVKFGKVLWLSVTPCPPPGFDEDDYEWIEIAPLDLTGYNKFVLAHLHRYIATSHCLTVQNDSWVVNPDAWSDDWLQYDYIGAPWPAGHTGTSCRVGNSGFCLRSKKMLEATSTLPNDGYVWRGNPKKGCRDDVITCVMFRERLEQQGLRFAPAEAAARFAFELPVSEAPTLDRQFGVHHYRRRGQPIAAARPA